MKHGLMCLYARMPFVYFEGSDVKPWSFGVRQVCHGLRGPECGVRGVCATGPHGRFAIRCQNELISKHRKLWAALNAVETSLEVSKASMLHNDIDRLNL